MHEIHRKEEGRQREYRPNPMGANLTNTLPPFDPTKFPSIVLMLAQSTYHAQSSPNTPNAQPSQNTSPSDQSAAQQSQSQQQPQQQQPQQSQQGTIQTMRLRQDAPSVTQSQSRPRKRKTPPSAEALQPAPPPPPPATMQHTLPPAHTLVPPTHLSGHVIPPPGYQYPPGDYSTGLPPPHTLAPPPTDPDQDRPQSQSSNGTPGTSRTLSQSKRAEQNRKAQRAFRERRDQYVCHPPPPPFFFFFNVADDSVSTR